MESSEDIERPDATTAFGSTEQNETNERSGFAPAPAQAGAQDENAQDENDGVRPPLASGEVDSTPVGARFADGGR